MRKKKVLFVVYYFIQAGGERYTYEIARALNKERFEIHFLKIYPLGSNKNWPNEYYYQPTLELGCKVHFYEDLLKSSSSLKRFKLFEQLSRLIPIGRLQAYTSNRVAEETLNTLQNFLNEFDIVNWMGNGIFAHLGRHTNPSRYKEYIHLLSTRFQYEHDLYAVWDKERSYHFFSPFSPWLLERELHGFKNFRHTYFPMSLSLQPYEVENSQKRKPPFIIAVFTRIDKLKPMEPYIYGLKLLLEKGVDAELHIYGAGDPALTGLKRQIEHLYITDKVKFKGHAESIETVMKTGEIDLVWFQSGNNRPAGFAAFEIAMSGVPQVFWDFAQYVPEPEYNEVYPNYTHLTNFVQKSSELLLDPAKRKELGLRQRAFVLRHQDIHQNIEIIESEFLNN
ncbi:MAG: hypothetical protein NZM35_01920 [Chitinophagales bacterium]|nr:hypothetical protein [Chitinophagales bacterium]MDW8418239.1 hypothetical protein [Chitinophagales bacterium]